MDDKVKDLIQNLLETKEKVEQNAVLYEQIQNIRSQRLEKIKEEFDNGILDQLSNLELEIDVKIKEMIDLERYSVNERIKIVETKREKLKRKNKTFVMIFLIIICLPLILGLGLLSSFLIAIIFAVAVEKILGSMHPFRDDEVMLKDFDDRVKRLKNFELKRINEIKNLSFIDDKPDDIGDKPINLLEKQVIELKKTIETIKQTNINNFEDFKIDYKGEDIPEIKELASKIKDNSKFLESESRVSSEYQEVDLLIKFISYLRNERATNLKDVFEIYLTEKRHEAEDEFRNKQLRQFESQSKYENELKERGLEIERQTMRALEAQAQSSMEIVAAEQALWETNQTTMQLHALSVNRDIKSNVLKKMNHLEHEINNKRDTNKSSLTGVLFGGGYSEYERVLKESQKKQSTLDQYKSETEKNEVLVEMEKDLNDVIEKIKR